MDRKELEEICKPQQPEETVEILNQLKNDLEVSDVDNEVVGAVGASIEVFTRLLEPEYPLTVKIRRMVWSV